MELGMKLDTLLSEVASLQADIRAMRSRLDAHEKIRSEELTRLYGVVEDVLKSVKSVEAQLAGTVSAKSTSKKSKSVKAR